MTDRGNHHPYVTEPSCSLQARIVDGNLVLTYVTGEGDSRHVQVYSYVNAPRDDKPGHVGDSHRHSLEFNANLTDGVLTVVIEDVTGTDYEIHYAGDWYLLNDLLAHTETSCATPKNTTTTISDASTTTTSVPETSTTSTTEPDPAPSSTTTTSALEVTTSTTAANQTESIMTTSAVVATDNAFPESRELAYTGDVTGALLGGAVLLTLSGVLARRIARKVRGL